MKKKKEMKIPKSLIVLKDFLTESKAISNLHRKDVKEFKREMRQINTTLVAKKTCRVKTKEFLEEHMGEDLKLSIVVEDRFIPYFVECVVQNKVDFSGYTFIPVGGSNREYDVIKVGDDLYE